MYEENIGYYISIIYRHMQIQLNKKLKIFKIGSGQYMYFIHISYNEGITQKELSQNLAIDKGTTAKAIKKLIEQGYLYYKVNPNDERSFYLYLTKEGKKILPRVQKILGEVSEAFKIGMNSSEKAMAISSLKKITKNIVEQI
ncbi:MAG: MarR family transcriptional regulator [Bacteroidota bacterium]|nr:MarR family transcriptional regulator [Bacteroidota bacterium]